MVALISSDSIYSASGPQGSREKQLDLRRTMLTMIERTSSSLSMSTSFAMSARPSVRYVEVSFWMSQRGARSIAW